MSRENNNKVIWEQQSDNNKIIIKKKKLRKQIQWNQCKFIRKVKRKKWNVIALRGTLEMSKKCRMRLEVLSAMINCYVNQYAELVWIVWDTCTIDRFVELSQWSTRAHIRTETHTHMHTHFVYESHKVANILLLLAKYVWTMIKLLARSIAMWAKHEGRRKRGRRREKTKEISRARALFTLVGGQLFQ